MVMAKQLSLISSLYWARVRCTCVLFKQSQGKKQAMGVTNMWVKNLSGAKVNYCSSPPEAYATKTKELVVKPDVFDRLPVKDRRKDTFISICRAYNKAVANDLYKSGHVEFIKKALESMEAFGVTRDIDCYNAILDCFPKEVMVPENKVQVSFNHFPRQQDCCLDVLSQMSENGILPDKRSYLYIRDSFGEETWPNRKIQRMMYWHPKFMNANPYLKNFPTIKEGMPDDALLLAILALQRMCIDFQNKISVYQTKDIPDSTDHTFIASGQSPEQRELLNKMPDKQVAYVSGPYEIWLRWKSVSYFTLTVDYTDKWKPPFLRPDRPENTFENWDIPFDADKDHDSSHNKDGDMPARRSCHEQSDGIVLSLCVTGTSSLDSLRSWIKLLQKENPHLANMAIIFRIKSKHAELIQRKEQLEKPRLGQPRTQPVKPLSL